MFEVMIVDDMEIMIKQIKRLPLWNEETGFRIVAEACDGLNKRNMPFLY